MELEGPHELDSSIKTALLKMGYSSGIARFRTGNPLSFVEERRCFPTNSDDARYDHLRLGIFHPIPSRILLNKLR